VTGHAKLRRHSLEAKLVVMGELASGELVEYLRLLADPVAIGTLPSIAIGNAADLLEDYMSGGDPEEQITMHPLSKLADRP
jgi:hypothetical protein